MNDIRQSFAQQGLIRPQEGRVLGGVIAGLGRRFGIDPWPARLLFVLLLMVIPGSPILIYPILWILMPSEETVTVQPSQVSPTPAPCPPTGISRRPATELPLLPPDVTVIDVRRPLRTRCVLPPRKSAARTFGPAPEGHPTGSP